MIAPRKWIPALVTASLGFALCGSAYAGEPVCVVGASDHAGRSLGSGGKGFAARAAGRTVLVTTAHGLTELMHSSDAKSLFNGNAGAVTVMDTAGRELSKAGTCILQNPRGGYYTSDVFVFDLSSSGGLDTYTMSPSLPAVGTKVWVISKEGSNFGATSGGDKYSGKVTTATMDGIMVRMDAPLTAYHSSGSPVVDDRGSVIGMLCGTTDGRMTIGINPSAAILLRLDPRAAAASSASAGVRRTGAGAASAANSSRGVQTYGRSGVQTYR